MTNFRASDDVYAPEADFSLTPLNQDDDPERLTLVETTSVQLVHGPPTAEPESEQGDEESGWSILRELVETIVLSLLIFLLIRGVVQNYRIESLSMQPNFYEGQFILVNKLAYRLGQPERGDVVVFHNPNNPSEDYIKRIIGLPGDTLEVRDQQIILNGQPLDEPYATNPIAAFDQFGPTVVEPDHIFVMGDNRPNSSDSRRIGAIDEELIVGRAWVRVWPVQEWEVIRHPDLHADLALDLLAPSSSAPNTALQQSDSPLGASQ